MADRIGPADTADPLNGPVPAGPHPHIRELLGTDTGERLAQYRLARADPDGEFLRVECDREHPRVDPEMGLQLDGVSIGFAVGEVTDLADVLEMVLAHEVEHHVRRCTWGDRVGRPPAEGS